MQAHSTTIVSEPDFQPQVRLWQNFRSVEQHDMFC